MIAINKRNTAIVAAGITTLAIALAAITPAFAAGGQGWGNGKGGRMGSGIVGSVTAVNGTALTVQSSRNNTSYAVDATNAVVTKNNAASSVSAIATGDTVAIQGTVNGTSVTAAKIFDGQFKPGMGTMRGGMGARPGVVGTVATVSGSTLTVTSQGFGNNAATTTYTVDATNATVVKNNATSTVSSIAVGDTVAVRGTVTGTNVAATMIRDGVMMQGRGQKNGVTGTVNNFQGNGQPVIAGTVSSVSGTTITLTNSGNTTYTIDASNAKIQKAGVSSATVSNVATGDTVLVQGTVNGTSVVATSVLDQAQAQSQKHGGFFGGVGQFFMRLFHF